MKAKTFKRQVEDAICVYYEDRKEIKCNRCSNLKECSSKTKRILAAHNAELDRIADGMGSLEIKPNYPDGFITESEGVKQCQAYIQAQKEGK